MDIAVGGSLAASAVGAALAPGAALQSQAQSDVAANVTALLGSLGLGPNIDALA
jgi:hypothetical protein